jgi:hypothetical protein
MEKEFIIEESKLNIRGNTKRRGKSKTIYKNMFGWQIFYGSVNLYGNSIYLSICIFYLLDDKFGDF